VTDRENRRQREQRDPTEGVRLIGADEAEEVLERDDIRHRLRDDEPRFGDRPPSPAPEGPRPALRFPLGSYDDPTTIERPAVVPVQPRTQAPELSHWAGSAAEEVPNMSRRDPRQGDPRQGDPRQGDPRQGDDAWSTFADSDPRWRDDPSMPPAGRPPSRPPGPPREPTRQQPGGTWPDPAPPAPPPGEPRPGAPVSYDDEVDQPPAPGRSVFADGGGEPPATYEDAYAEEGYADEYEPAYDETYDDVYEEDVYTDEPAAGAYPADPRGAVAAPRRRAPGRAPRRMPDRDLRTAVGVAVLFAAVALALFQFGEELGGMIVAVPVVTYAAYEYFVAANKAGHQAIMPVGVVATAALVIAAYNYGEGAIPLVMVLAIAVCFLWYLVRASTDEPVSNIGATLLGIGWIGLFGSFAGLLLSDPVGGNGVALLLAAVIPTIGYDVGALFVGRSAGSRPLSDASPNKTIEGLLGGMFLAVVAAVVFAGIVEVHPFDSIGEGITLGVLVALVAPLGDLSESLIKRDLGVKDMGSVLPGHGGLLDRFDALLFVLPAVWYLARVSDFFLT
jgi:phosphatidate cytidylyltransferase